MDLDWREVSVTINTPDNHGTEAILSRCSGRVRMGRMVAIMGPSGAGKTTLLSCLCQEMPHTGTITYDGARFSPTVRQLISLCEQDDIISGFLTVEQFLLFYAQMRFGISDSRASASIVSSLKVVQLENILDSPIHRLAAGERKRLCIARELLSEPKMFLFDEPTKGLDILAAYQVMSVIRALCDSGKISCLSTMYQPTSKIFEQFQDLILMRRGEMVFFGPTSQVEPIFASVGLKRSPSQSIAEYLIHCLATDPHEPGGMTHEMHAQFLTRARRLCSALPQVATPLVVDRVSRYQATFQRQLFLLTHRFGLQAMQDLFTTMLLTQHTLEMGIASFAWWQLTYREADVRPRFAICNWIIAHWCTYGTQMHMFTWSFLQPQLKKDIRSGLYSAPAVFLARVVMMSPLEIVWPTYWTTGMICITNVAPDLHSSCQVIMVTWLIYSLYQASSLAVGALCKDFINVQCLVFLFLTYSLLWSGFWVDVNRLPGLLAYLQYGNPLWYGVTLLSYSALPDHAQFSCDEAHADDNGCRWNFDGKLVLFGKEARARHRIIGQMPPWMCICVLCGMLVFWWIVGFLALQSSLQNEWAMSQEEDVPVTQCREGDQDRIITFKTSWASSQHESMHNDDSRVLDSWQQQRSALL